MGLVMVSNMLNGWPILRLVGTEGGGSIVLGVDASTIVLSLQVVVVPLADATILSHIRV
jgi:hypothetical protein